MSTLLEKIKTKTATVGIVGLGYVGLPLAMAASRAGIVVHGFDLDQNKLQMIRNGQSYIEAVTAEELALADLTVTDDFSKFADLDVIVICVPTPLTVHRTPDLTAVLSVLDAISAHAKPNSLVILESTTWPGTTEEILAPGLANIENLFLGFSPEREDPGNSLYNTTSIPKLVAGLGDVAGDMIEAFYASFLKEVIRVSAPSVAEAAKLTENVFRAVNIALVNELKLIYDRMNIDVWEVIDAAATKPFGFMPFYPGPGLGGHCIPVDPYYLSWKAREYGLNAQFIELAGEINISMPDYVISKLREVLDTCCALPLSKSRILAVGAAYKKNVSDLRESPSIEIMARLSEKGASVTCLDPHVEVLSHFQRPSSLEGQKTIDQASIVRGDFDLVIILTDHDAVNYRHLSELNIPIVDTRNVMERNGLRTANIYKA